jgi:hypothetical protein
MAISDDTSAFVTLGVRLIAQVVGCGVGLAAGAASFGFLEHLL